MESVLVNVDRVTVSFPLNFEKVNTFSGQLGAFAKRIGSGKIKARKVQRFRALNSVSLIASDGDVIGVIGANGSGKTTLLRAIAGIYQPDSGSVDTLGSLSTLLSLGTGFNNMLTGRRNIFMVGYLMGMTKSDISDRVADIVAYAELEEFIDVPVKYYSNGMISRLGFAIATTMEPEILLVDEIFSVGDLAFKAKSERTVRSLLERASCQVVVTHSLSFVKESCNRAVYVRDGEIVHDGEPQQVVAAYEEYVAANPRTAGSNRVYTPSD